MKSSQPIFFLNSHVTISNITPKMTLGGREKACKIIGCNSEYFWDTAIQTFCFIYCDFALVTKMFFNTTFKVSFMYFIHSYMSETCYTE